jgi:hypothetical protein
VAAASGVEDKCVAQRLVANKGGREEENRRKISVAPFKRWFDKPRNTKPLIARVPSIGSPSEAVTLSEPLRLRGGGRQSLVIRTMSFSSKKN